MRRFGRLIPRRPGDCIGICPASAHFCPAVEARRAAVILIDKATTYDMTRRLDREAIKVRILTLLKDRPLRNAEIRAFTDLDRQQAYRILRELAADGLIVPDGHGQAACWRLKQSLSKL